MPRLVAMETHALILWFGLGSFGLIPFRLRSNLAFGFGLSISHTTLSFVILNQQHRIGLLYILLNIFKHPMQLSNRLVHPVHVKVHEKLVINFRQ